MTVLGFLIPAALLLGLGGLLAFFWTVKSGQYEDLDGAAARILIEDEADRIEPDKIESGKIESSPPKAHSQRG